MNANKLLLLWVIAAILLVSCTTTDKVSTDRKSAVSFQAGANYGGITENTDMTVVPGVKVPPEAIVDGFTGATRTGFNAGVHLNQRLKRNQVEIGVDYMYNHQTFNYTDAGNMYIGVRRLHVSQWMIPVTYNMVLFRNSLPKIDFALKIGLLGQLNYIPGKGTGILPEYSVLPFSGGPTLGVSFCPFTFRNGNKLGVYADIYRGSQVYKDFYNQPEYEMPGSSFCKFGLRYQMH